MLAVHRLQAVRDDRILFSALDFTLQAGQIVQVVGPNGIGKTTLLNIIVGLGTADAGEIHWQQQAVDEDPATFRRACSYLGHQLGLKLLLSPLENLRFLLRLRGVDAHDASISRALDKVGLSGYEDTPLSHLSAGQKRRVALARLFLEQTPLWVLDEPFTAIDHAGVSALEGWLADHAAAGGMILLTTHHRFADDFPVQRLELSRFAASEAL